VQERLVGLGAPGELERALYALCPGAPSAPPRGGTALHPEPRQARRFPLGRAGSTERLYIADSGQHRSHEC
ncbi:hypothetical protein AAGG42_22870, partial [Stenotrophomonas maltophilia]